MDYKLLYFNRRCDKDLFAVSTLGEKHPGGVGGHWFSLCTLLETLILSLGIILFICSCQWSYLMGQ